MLSFGFLFFFFQAEDGIRDVAVTGVQTCALPISLEEQLREGEPQGWREQPVGLPDRIGDAGCLQSLPRLPPQGIYLHFSTDSSVLFAAISASTISSRSPSRT